MSEGTSKRREWVKNAAIIFLSVMLVLTFFSNTIMNYSLPEVATVYVQPGSITAKVRGTGNVEATDPYKVIAKESRVITSVPVKQGDEVEKDDVLYYLEDAESEELTKAEAELNAMVLDYMLSLFNGDVSNSIINKVESGNTDSFNNYQSKISGMQNSVKAAQDNVAAHQTNVDNLTKQLDLLANNSTADTTAEQNAVNEAQQGVTDASNKVTNIQAKLTNLESRKTDLEAQIAAVKALVPGVDTTGGTQAGGIQLLQEKEALALKAKNDAPAELQKAINDILKTYESDFSELSPDAAFEEAKSKTELARVTKDNKAQFEASKAAYETYLTRYNATFAAYDVAKKNTEEGTKQLQNYSADVEKLKKLEEEISDVRDELRSATNNVTNANSTLTTAQQILADKKENKSNASSQKDINNKLIEAKSALTTAKTQLEKLQTEQTDLIKNLQAELNLDNKNELIELKEQEIEKLKEKSMGSAVKAPVAGTVTNLAHVAGETIKLDEEIAVIQVAGKGFSVSFTVTNEQAQKVQVGDTAELQNSWYYQDMQIILTSVKPDPDNPGQRKRLTFSVNSSDVQAGQALNISVGQRSANYELVVPNSAIREDNNGKFILIVEPRNSPLGNRYFATRVDVEVVASDDNNTAVSAGLYGYEYVITTATKPVTAGKQVRLSD